MKKKVSLIMVIMLLAALLAGCGSTMKNEGETDQTETAQSSGQKSQAEPVDVRVMALKGPTAMGMVKLMDDADSGNVETENYTFDIAPSADEVTPKLVQGEVDIAAVPANLSSVLYNKTEGQIQVLAINTLGILYIVENGDSVHSVADLEGKTIYASGKGSTPEYALNYILEKNGLVPGEDVTIEWKSEHSECVSELTQDPEGIAMLPQPFVTTAQAKNPDLKVALDLTEEWDKLMEGEAEKSRMLTGVVVVRREFAEENPEAVSDFMERYASSVEYVNANVEDAAGLVEKYDIVTRDVAVKAIPECNIVCITGEDMKEQLSGYLQVLLDQNPESIGGKLPEDDFYYVQ